MRAVERLRRDHQILSGKLNVLESGLAMGEEAWFVLREVCFTLARQLQDHMQREEELVERCRRVMNPKVLAEMAVEHRDEPRLLRIINDAFVSQQDHSLARIRPMLMEAIHGLRRHMREEEMELFPLFERTLTGPEPDAPEGGPQADINETMTVNRVVNVFPDTRPVFERLFISVPAEGCRCLDEVAWTHGMDSGELLDKLDAVIHPTVHERRKAEQQAQPCECAIPE